MNEGVDARGGDCGAHTRSASCPDDAEDAVGGNERFCGGDDVKQKGASADLVQDFGALAFEPRPLARGHDGYCKTCGFHGGYLLTSKAIGSNRGREHN